VRQGGGLRAETSWLRHCPTTVGSRTCKKLWLLEAHVVVAALAILKALRHRISSRGSERGALTPPMRSLPHDEESNKEREDGGDSSRAQVDRPNLSIAESTHERAVVDTTDSLLFSFANRHSRVVGGGDLHFRKNI
jgi:hypothetical protein